MMRALSTAATGMQAQQTKLDVTANNIANVGTVGFKKSRVEFSDLLYQTQSGAGSATSSLSKTPQAVQVGMGVRVDGTARLETQGTLKNTGDTLNMAIEGAGYFQVVLPSGETAYTRAGAFTRDADGYLVNSNGYRLATDVNIPPEAGDADVDIAANGVVMVRMPGQVELEEAGRIELATFANAGGLEALGDNLFRQTEGSGAPVTVTPGEAGTGHLRAGWLEMSNVSVVEEMVELISGQRAYEVNSRVVKAADEMLQQATNIR